MEVETPAVRVNVGDDHDLLIRMDEKLTQFLSVQKDHTNTLADHAKQLAEHELRLGHAISVRGLMTGVASAIGGSLGFMQLIEWIQKAH